MDKELRQKLKLWEADKSDLYLCEIIENEINRKNLEIPNSIIEEKKKLIKDFACHLRTKHYMMLFEKFKGFNKTSRKLNDNFMNLLTANFINQTTKRINDNHNIT